jgi:hypothetical protein
VLLTAPISVALPEKRDADNISLGPGPVIPKGCYTATTTVPFTGISTSDENPRHDPKLMNRSKLPGGTRLWTSPRLYREERDHSFSPMPEQQVPNHPNCDCHSAPELPDNMPDWLRDCACYDYCHHWMLGDDDQLF